MTEKHSQIEVSVFDHTGKVLDRGIVVLEPREQTGAPKHSLKFDPRRGSYVGSGITPGTYVRRHLGMPQISGKCRWTQPDCRPPMILGTPGLPYLYRGNVKNPFQPHVELIAVALDSRTAGQSLERIREIAKQHELSEVDVSEQVRRQHVHVFRFASEASAGEQERIGEVLALRWGKIDWQRQAIIVDEGLYEGEVSTPKTTSGVRILPMTKLLFSALLQWKTGKTVGADNFIFPSAVGTGFCRRNLSNRFLKPAAAAAGIGNVSWHMLRRTHSTWLKDVGATPGVIQHQLGHSDPRLAFELYVMSVPVERRRAVDRVSSQLKRLLDPNSTHAPVQVLVGESRSALLSAG